MAQMTFPIDTSIPEMSPLMKEHPDMDWRPARRVKGFGDCYMPVYKRIVREEEIWFIPKHEVDERPDWEEIIG